MGYAVFLLLALLLSGCQSKDEETDENDQATNTTNPANPAPTAPGETRHALTVTLSGSGSVSSSPAGISCGTDCSEDYLANTTVTLSAVADSGFTFSGWSGGGCNGTGNCVVTLTQAATVTASFAQQQTSRIPAKPATYGEAVRFLTRATFGATDADVQKLLQIGYEPWLEEQFSAQPYYQWPALEARLIQFGYENINDFTEAYHRRELRSDAWWDAALHANDQLRQRVAFALSQIFVISENDGTINNRVSGVAAYNDILVEHAFGNFRELLEAVTLNPMMGDYLSMRRNEKADPARNIQPDENYAREVMQLFTIGLYELNTDGSRKLDGNGKPIPTYGQNEILNFARVFTGWNYFDAPRLRSNTRTLLSERTPMAAFNDYHDMEEKTLLAGQELPAGQTAEQDMEMAMDNLFNHPNVGPFIGKQLIQRLVTSNPSPAYIRRVAEVFNDNGSGVRGDLRAVVNAVLMDEEAIFGHEDAPTTFGKLKEPLLMLTQLWRALDATSKEAGDIRYYNSLADLGQMHLAAPSVFNFYLPSYSQPGEINDMGMVSPEFQIFNESTATSTFNRLRDYANSYNLGTGDKAARKGVDLNLEDETALVGTPAALVSHFNDLLLAGDMSPEMQTLIMDMINQTYASATPDIRVREALLMVISSPEFAIQR
jgi:uncharacterized protein (DUF1800 family)